MPVGTHQRLSGAWRLCSCCLHLLMHSTPLCIHWTDKDGFACSLAGNKWSIWDYCDNAVISKMSWSWNYWSVNVLQQGTVARSVCFYMCDQLYRYSTRKYYRSTAQSFAQSYHLYLKYTNIIRTFRCRLADNKQYIQYFGCTDRRLEQKQHFLLNVSPTVKKTLICASCKYVVLGSSSNKK